ncbi:hypothetical protein [Bacillus sp. ISL-37]|jgi:hypothetical protein|uniref:hypothetical protein n=1 Tax=Bacillus sp. ISL-37 TaxID=2819123 RepID=UPI001BEACFE5|nr:hypothetical protein [Bacillus sp. ISL-37]MBT2684720.1 hypothetical protein [Bacillus sp. ISL-37]
MSETKMIYFNSAGKVIDEPVRLQQEGCDNQIEFCKTVTVPDGFTFEFDGFDNFSLCSDASDLACMLENVEVDATIANPCGGELTCPVILDAVRAIGCVRVHVNVGRLVPIQPALNFNFGCDCTLCFDQTVCVNQVIGYTCDRDNCAEDCFRFGGGFVGVIFGEIDQCGRQTVTVVGGIDISFAGC